MTQTRQEQPYQLIGNFKCHLVLEETNGTEKFFNSSVMLFGVPISFSTNQCNAQKYGYTFAMSMMERCSPLIKDKVKMRFILN